MVKLKNDVTDMDDALIEKFEKDRNMIYNRKDENHKFLLNEYLKDNFEEWVDKYISLLSNYDMGVKFINTKDYNLY